MEIIDFLETDVENVNSIGKQLNIISHLYDPNDIIEIKFIHRSDINCYTNTKRSHPVYRTASQFKTKKFAKYIVHKICSGYNCFYTPNPRFKKLGNKSSKIKDVKSFSSFYLDFDNYSYNDVIKAVKENGLPEPTLIISSGNGIHLYWKMKFPLPNNDFFRAYFREFVTKSFKGSIKPDTACKDVSRVLRLPGSYNLKAKPLFCKIIKFNPKVYLPHHLIKVNHLFDDYKKYFGSKEKTEKLLSKKINDLTQAYEKGFKKNPKGCSCVGGCSCVFLCASLFLASRLREEGSKKKKEIKQRKTDGPQKHLDTSFMSIILENPKFRLKADGEIKRNKMLGIIASYIKSKCGPNVFQPDLIKFHEKWFNENRKLIKSDINLSEKEFLYAYKNVHGIKKNFIDAMKKDGILRHPHRNELKGKRYVNHRKILDLIYTGCIKCHNDFPFFSLNDLTEYTKTEKSNVSRAIKKLIELKYIIVIEESTREKARVFWCPILDN